MPLVGGWGGFRLPTVEDITQPPPMVTPIGGFVKAITQPLIFLGGVAGGAILGSLLGGKQEQQQDQTAAIDTTQQQEQDVTATQDQIAPIDQSTKSTIFHYYKAGGDITTGETDVTQAQSAQPTQETQIPQITVNIPEIGQSATQSAMQFDMSGLIIIAAILGGAYLLKGKF